MHDPQGILKELLGICADICVISFFKNSCEDISIILMMISRKAISQRIEWTYSLQL